jgi:hypothetical protein
MLSMLFGVLVGAAEIIARYRDEPFAATFSRPGISYLALNGVISAAAYFLLVYYDKSILPGLAGDRLLTSIVAGFGSMIVMRSKLFSFKTEGGEDYAIGLDAVLSTFLMSVDRRIDRNRSSKRQKLVYEEVAKISDLSKAPDFLRISLASYQNLSDAEKKELDDVILKLQAENLDPRLKLMAMGFGFLNISGEANFKELMKQLKSYVDSLPPDSAS